MSHTRRRWPSLWAVTVLVVLAIAVPRLDDLVRARLDDLVHAELQSSPASPAAASTDVAILDALAVGDSEAPAPYDRDEFGQRWADIDRDGCDQRNNALARDLIDIEYRPGTRDCVVERGTLADPYSGELVVFEKVDGGIDIDHVVPLAAAWRAGAWSWTEQRRTEFANDLGNLQATSSSINRSKGDQGVDEWLPPDHTYACTYATRWVQIKTRWALSVTSTEKASLEQLLERC